MELLIHFGIYKAGSSYIQYLAVNSRETLKDQEVYFPESQHDDKMRSGMISPGNASDLRWLLDNKEEEKCIRLFKHWIKEAEHHKCSKVLISSESLVHALATEKGLSTLVRSSDKAGFSNVKAMGFFRDLVDHALSTYKHRAKSGKHKDYKDWIENVYETPKVLENFFENAQNYPIEWTFRKFKMDSSYMAEAFFKDWLGVKLTSLPEKPKVNESVTLSEVLLMQEVSRQYPLVTSYFVEALKELPKESKAKDKELEEYYRYHAYQFLKQYDKDVQKWNQFFPAKEQLQVVESIPDAYGDAFNPQLSLSPEQMKTILQLTNYFDTAKGRFIKGRRLIARSLPAVVKKISC